jgi:hypothetical protein
MSNYVWTVIGLFLNGIFSYKSCLNDKGVGSVGDRWSVYWKGSSFYLSGEWNVIGGGAIIV